MKKLCKKPEKDTNTSGKPKFKWNKLGKSEKRKKFHRKSKEKFHFKNGFKNKKFSCKKSGKKDLKKLGSPREIQVSPKSRNSL